MRYRVTWRNRLSDLERADEIRDSRLGKEIMYERDAKKVREMRGKVESKTASRFF